MSQNVRHLTSKQRKQITQMAEQARAALSRFAGREIAYNPSALQLLDEWVDRHLKQFPDPSRKIRLLWASFLGEILRRHHEGRWVMLGNGRAELTVSCLTGSGQTHNVNVSSLVDQRVEQGMAAALSYAYTMTAIELKAR